jgi:hypothetical protein
MKTVAVFPYVQIVHPQIGSIFQPLLDVTLRHDNMVLQVGLFLDSGADISIVPDSLGQALGLVRGPSSAVRVRSLSNAYTHLTIVEAYLQIGASPEMPFRLGWADTDEVPALLGCLDVFERYTFEFNHDHRLVIVKH